MVNIFALKACVSFAQIGWTIIRVQSEWTVWLPDDTEWVYCQRILRHWFEGQEFWIIRISSKRSACMLKMYIILSNLLYSRCIHPYSFDLKFHLNGQECCSLLHVITFDIPFAFPLQLQNHTWRVKTWMTSV